MKWLRSNIRQGSRFALAVLCALSFGHFHAAAAQAAPAIQSGAAPSDVAYGKDLSAPDAVGESAQQPAVVDRSRHARAALRNRLEADPAVIGLISDQQHEATALHAGFPERAIQQRAADATAAEWRLDRQRSQQQGLGIADKNRQLAHRADQQRADAGRELSLIHI